MRIIECEQRSPEWYAARLGVPTASEFGSIITPKRGEYAAAADVYVNELIDEIVRPNAVRSFDGNRHTRRGNDLEPEARELYAFLHDDEEIVQVGFVLSDCGSMGCSPDSLIRRRQQWERGLEIKAPDGPTHVRWLRAGGLPDEYKAQVHGSMLITGLPWDFMSYCPGYEPMIVRAQPNEFTEKLRGYLARFRNHLEEAKAAIGMKDAA